MCRVLNQQFQEIGPCPGSRDRQLKIASSSVLRLEKRMRDVQVGKHVLEVHNFPFFTRNGRITRSF